MLVKKTFLGTGVAALAAVCSGGSMAHAETVSSVMAMGTSSLRSEMESRYNEALALSQDQSVVAVDSTRFMWASQAKVQCGIAIGYLKSGYKDPVSVGKCIDAHLRMRDAPMVAVAPLPAPPALCSEKVAGVFFFEWDSAVPPADAMTTIDTAITNLRTCNWPSISVVGHTDRSGSDGYNDRLSDARVRAIAQLLLARGLSPEQVKVDYKGERQNRIPTADGVREPQNRRVELTVD